MPILPKRPSLLMHFDDNIVDSSKDIVQNVVLYGTVGNKVIIKGADSVAGETIYIDGSKYVQTQNGANPDSSGSFTISVWENLLKTATHSSALFGLSTAVNVSHSGLIFGYNNMSDGTGDRRQLYCSSNGTSWDQISQYNLGTPVYNEWVHWEAGYDRPNKKLYIFKNGVLLNTFTLTADPIYSTARYLTIGCYNGVVVNASLMADFSFTAGTCNHTSDFTPDPPTSTAITKAIHPMISDVQSKFGGSSLYLSGGNSLSFPADSALTDTSRDFTISFWEYLINGPNLSASLYINNSSSPTPTTNGLIIGYNGSASSKYLYAGSSSSWNIADAVLIESIANVINRWAHWEVCYRESSKMLYVFLDGTLKHAVVCPSPIRLASPSYGMLGRWTTYQTCYMEELLVLPGICMHTDNFTPPEEPYSISSAPEQGMELLAIPKGNRKFVAPGKQLTVINGNKSISNSAGKTFDFLNKGQSLSQNYFGKPILPLGKGNYAPANAAGVTILGGIGSRNAAQYLGKFMELFHDSNAAYKFDLMVTPTHVFRTQLANVVSNYRPNLGLTGKYRLKVGENEAIPYGAVDSDLANVECNITQAMLDYGVNKCRLEYLFPNDSTEFLDFEVLKEEPRRTLVERTFKRYDGGYDGSWLNSAPFGISKSPCFLVPEDSTSTLIKTTDYTSISLTKNRGVLGVNIDASGAKILVSFDQGEIWKSYGVDGWYDAGIENIATVGLSEDVINSITSAQWADVFTSTSLDFAVHLDNKLSAYVDISKDALVYSFPATYARYTWGDEYFLITKADSSLGTGDSIIAYYSDGTSKVVARWTSSNNHPYLTFDGVDEKYPSSIVFNYGWNGTVYAAPKLAYLRSINVTLSDRFKTGYAFVI
jgi:hypothetical protein